MFRSIFRVTQFSQSPITWSRDFIKNLFPILPVALCLQMVYVITAQAEGDKILPGTEMQRDRVYKSENGIFETIFQADGNLVLRTKDGSFIWGTNVLSNVEFTRAASVKLTSAGRLMMTDASGKEIWATTAGSALVRDLSVTNYGQLVVTLQNPNNSISNFPHNILWSSLPIASFPVEGGQIIETQTQFHTPEGFYMTFQPDRNLVVARRNDAGFVWGLNLEKSFNFRDSRKIEMRIDGTLVVLNDNGNTLWSVPQNGGTPGSVLQLSPRGVLFIQRPDGSIAWASDGNTSSPPAQTAPTPAPVAAVKTPADEDREGREKYGHCWESDDPDECLQLDEYMKNKYGNCAHSDEPDECLLSR